MIDEEGDPEVEFDEDVVLTHAPVVSCRKHVYGEGIYVDHWQRFIVSPIEYGDGYVNDRFIAMFGHLPGVIRQSDAADAAALICWLGTNVGRGFLLRGAAITKLLPPERDDNGFLYAWAEVNVRQAGWNGGRRVIDALVADAGPRTIEIFEIVAHWLGTPDGKTLVKAAEAEIDATRRAIFEQESMKNRAQLRAAELARGEK